MQTVKSIIHRPDLMGPKPESDVQPTLVFENPGPITKFKRLMVALKHWRKAGLKLTPRSMRKARDAACAVCPYWDPKGNWGWGECLAPGCGCTRFKQYLLSSTCPHPDGSRWPQMQPPAAAPPA